MTTDEQKPGALVAGAAAILTVTAAIIYFAGGFALAARLWAQRFPSSLVITHMPRQILQGVAVSSVLVPSVVLALLLFLVPFLLLPRTCRLRTTVGRWFQQAPWLSFPTLAVLLLGPGAYLWTQQGDDIRGGLRKVPWWLILLGVLAVVLYAIVISCAMPWIERYRREHPGSPLWVAMVAIVVMLIAVPGSVVGAATYPLAWVRVCSASYEMDARLIAATSDRVYLAQYFYGENGKEITGSQIVLIPPNTAALTVSSGKEPGCGPQYGYLEPSPRPSTP